MKWLTRFLDWLFPIRLSPYRTCRNCGKRKAKEDMICDAHWFCNQDCIDDWLEKTNW